MQTAEEGGPEANCPLAFEGNTATVVAGAESQPGWVQIDLTILLDTDASALPADIESRLQALGAQNVREDSFINAVDATVTAADVPQLACWPGVKELSGDGLGCGGSGSCTDPCLTQCGPNCAPLAGTLVDVASGCVNPGVSLGCIGQGVATGAGDLTCYVQIPTGDVFAVSNPFVVADGDTALRLCTPAEGGSQSPATLPICP
jgi:hypothetical protein